MFDIRADVAGMGGVCAVAGCGPDNLRRRKEGVKVLPDSPDSGGGQGQALLPT